MQFTFPFLFSDFASMELRFVGNRFLSCLPTTVTTHQTHQGRCDASTLRFSKTLLNDDLE